MRKVFLLLAAIFLTSFLGGLGFGLYLCDILAAVLAHAAVRRIDVGRSGIDWLVH